MTAFWRDPWLTALLAATVAAQAAFASFPGIDLAVSAALTDGAGRFAAATHWSPPLVSAVLRRGMELVALIATAAALWAWATGALGAAGARCAGFAALALLIGPGLIVNGLLKAEVGRARPVHTADFGGQARFSPAFEVAGECPRNCSFTSGEAALAATFAIVVVVLAWPHLPPARRWRWVAGAAAAFAAVGGLRVALGRHFLSDVVFSGLICAFVALALYHALGIGPARRALVPARVVRQLRRATRRHLVPS